MRVDGQLQCAQLEQIADDAPTPAVLGRMYLDTKNSGAVPYLRGLSRWERVLTDSMAYATKTANYTILLQDQFITFDASAGSITGTLPSAAAATGKFYDLLRTDSVIANDVTISGAAGGETIDGTASFILKTKNDRIRIFSTGAVWVLISHTWDTGWVTFTPSGANWVANTTTTAKYRRTGKSIDAEWNFALTGAPDSLQCVGVMPTGFQIDIAAMANSTAGRQFFPAGVLIFDTSATATYAGYATFSSDTAIGFMYSKTDITVVNVDATHPVTFATGDSVNARVSGIPIVKLR